MSCKADHVTKLKRARKQLGSKAFLAAKMFHFKRSCSMDAEF